jgi:hypothetical protein
MRVSIVTIGASALALAAFCCSKTATARQAEPRPPQRILAPAERCDLSPDGRYLRTTASAPGHRVVRPSSEGRRRGVLTIVP